MKIKFLLLLVLLASCKSKPEHNRSIENSEVKIAGAMKNVMINGQLEGFIDLDSIKNKENLIGLGPIEYLSGEILILDGHSYISKVTSDSTMLI